MCRCQRKYHLQRRHTGVRRRLPSQTQKYHLGSVKQRNNKRRLRRHYQWCHECTVAVDPAVDLSMDLAVDLSMDLAVELHLCLPACHRCGGIPRASYQCLRIGHRPRHRPIERLTQWVHLKRCPHGRWRYLPESLHEHRRRNHPVSSQCLRTNLRPPRRP
eukprot:symbB.v1.2.024416.t1/scaffold2309.1/size82710/2